MKCSFRTSNIDPPVIQRLCRWSAWGRRRARICADLLGFPGFGGRLRGPVQVAFGMLIFCKLIGGRYPVPQWRRLGLYNPRRRHSTIGYLDPMQCEALAEAG